MPVPISMPTGHNITYLYYLIFMTGPENAASKVCQHFLQTVKDDWTKIGQSQEVRIQRLETPGFSWQ
jgi:hypothetical protein